MTEPNPWAAPESWTRAHAARRAPPAPPAPIEAAPADRTPWATGLLVAALATALTVVAIFAFGTALARIHPAIAVVINVVAIGGFAPSIWRWRYTPVVRWLVYGATAGVAIGWLALLGSAF